VFVQQEVKINWALSNAFKGCDHSSRKKSAQNSYSIRERKRERIDFKVVGIKSVEVLSNNKA
jgi:hypothetical protein